MLDEGAIPAARGAEQQHPRVVLALGDDDRVDFSALDREHGRDRLVFLAVVHAGDDQAHPVAVEQRDRCDPYGHLHAGRGREPEHGDGARTTIGEQRGEQRVIGRAHDLDDLPAEQPLRVGPEQGGERRIRVQDLTGRADHDGALPQTVDRQSRPAPRILEQHDLALRHRVRDDDRIHPAAGDRLDRALRVLEPPTQLLDLSLEQATAR